MLVFLLSFVIGSGDGYVPTFWLLQKQIWYIHVYQNTETHVRYVQAQRDIGTHMHTRTRTFTRTHIHTTHDQMCHMHTCINAYTHLRKYGANTVYRGIHRYIHTQRQGSKPDHSLHQQSPSNCTVPQMRSSGSSVACRDSTSLATA